MREAKREGVASEMFPLAASGVLSKIERRQARISLVKVSIKSLLADLRDYAHRVLRGLRTMSDVIQLAVEGRDRPWPTCCPQ